MDAENNCLRVGLAFARPCGDIYKVGKVGLPPLGRLLLLLSFAHFRRPFGSGSRELPHIVRPPPLFVNFSRLTFAQVERAEARPAVISG